MMDASAPGVEAVGRPGWHQHLVSLCGTAQSAADALRDFALVWHAGTAG